MIDLPILVKECAAEVAPTIMRALIQVESAVRPFAIGYKVVGRGGEVFTLRAQPASAEQAVIWTEWLLQKGYRFDAGIAQINSVNFARYGLTPANVFDLCTNIRAGARILSECFVRARALRDDRQGALNAALSCYNSGNFHTGIANGYVAKVVAAADAANKPLEWALPPLERSRAARAKGRGSTRAPLDEVNPMNAPTTVKAFEPLLPQREQ